MGNIIYSRIGLREIALFFRPLCETPPAIFVCPNCGVLSDSLHGRTDGWMDYLAVPAALSPEKVTVAARRRDCEARWCHTFRLFSGGSSAPPPTGVAAAVSSAAGFSWRHNASFLRRFRMGFAAAVSSSGFRFLLARWLLARSLASKRIALPRSNLAPSCDFIVSSTTNMAARAMVEGA